MPDEPVSLRPATLADAGPLAQFARSSFAATYGATHDAGRIRIHCDTVLSDACFAEALGAAGHEFMLAWRDADVIGFTQLLPSAAPVSAARPIELKRFYVDPSAHGQGLAQRLFDAALVRAHALQGDLLWLCVYPGNERAQRFYARQGLQPIGRVPYHFVDLTEEDLALGLRLPRATGQSGGPPLYSPPS